MTSRVAIAGLCAAFFLVPQQQASNARTERLAKLAELDGAVRYFHPLVATGVVHWDALLASRAVAIANAPDGAAYARGISDLLSQLGDGGTAIAGTPRRWVATTNENVVTIAPGTGTAVTQSQIRTIAAAA